MNFDDINKLDKNTIFFITAGSVEAHGPHLPLATDFFIAKKIEEKMLKKFNGVSLPPVYYAKCHYLENFAGTLSVKSIAIKKILEGVMKSLSKNGFSYLVICNFHMDIFHLRSIYKAILKGRKYGIRSCEPISYAYFNDIFGKREDEIHADEVETSLALYLFPDLVGEYKKVPPYRIKIPRSKLLKKFDRIGVKNAYIGTPSNATPERGKIYFEKLLHACEDGIKRMMNGEILIPEKLKFFLRI